MKIAPPGALGSDLYDFGWFCGNYAKLIRNGSQILQNENPDTMRKTILRRPVLGTAKGISRSPEVAQNKALVPRASHRAVGHYKRRENRAKLPKYAEASAMEKYLYFAVTERVNTQTIAKHSLRHNTTQSDTACGAWCRRASIL